MKRDENYRNLFQIVWLMKFRVYNCVGLPILRSPISKLIMWDSGFPGGAVVESPPADAGDTGSCPRPGRSHMPRSG